LGEVMSVFDFIGVVVITIGILAVQLSKQMHRDMGDKG